MNDNNDNPYAGPGQSLCFVTLISLGMPVEDAAEVVGISPEEVAMGRAMAPEFYEDLDEYARITQDCIVRGIRR